MVNNQEILIENVSLDVYGVFNVERFGDSYRILKLSSYGLILYDLDLFIGNIIN